MSPKLVDCTNHRRRLLDRGRGFEFGGNTSSPTVRFIGTRVGSVATTPVAPPKIASLQTRRKPKDKETGSEENKQFDLGGKGEESPPWKAGVPVWFSFLGGIWAWVPVACALCFCLSVMYCSYQVIIFQRAEKYERKEESR